jgi:hypothetical protein
MSKSSILCSIGRSRQFVLNGGWKSISLQMILVNVCSTWSMKHGWNKNAFWDVKNQKWRKWCKFVSPCLLNNPYGLPVFTIDHKSPKEVICIWFVDLQIICAKYRLETWFFPNDDIRKCLLDIKQGWIINAFWIVNNKKWREWCK